MTDVNIPAAKAKSHFLITGIGGSAGSIPAFREFFRNVPADSGMAFVVILHLSPEYDSHLAEVLQGSATIPVTQVRESVKVEPDHVYVIPPNKSMAMHDGTLVLSDMTGFEVRRAPVDIFFRTLADTHDSRAVCVVLSGSGADGSMGLRRIKENNGLVLVQDPREAEFEEMPRNSIATGLVDVILPVSEMPARIAAYRDQLRNAPLAFDERSEDDEQALIDIFTSLRVRTGHDFSNYKRATVVRRIERRMALHQLAQLSEYAQHMRDRTDEPEQLLRELLISVTNFFRDVKVWERIEQTIVPKLFEGKGADDHVRVWVPGCATGEEAYSIAMLLIEEASRIGSAANIQIFATDLDEDAIAKARNGSYNAADVADVSPERLRRHFVREQETFRVRRELRELVLFAHHNLLKDPPFSHIDFVSCRNVLIYLNRTAQERTMEVLHFALEPEGYLLLGTAESSDGSSQLFSTLDKEAHIYQSRAVPRVVTMPAPARQLTIAADLRAAPQQPHDRAASRLRFGPLDIHQRLLEEYAPPSLIVDDEHNVVHLSERAGRYLQFGAGDASLNVLEVARPELRIALRTALFQAGQKEETVAIRNIDVHTGEHSERVNVVVRPVSPTAIRAAAGYFLILFEEARPAHGAEVRTVAPVEPAARQVEEELIRVKTQMRATVEQYEVQAEEAKAANEELQAINEELRSTAEELETSQEELQSLNEELQTVNQELKVKIEEIGHTNDDLRNLMSSTEIGTIFVDRSLRVKLFTPRVRDIFNLIPADVGRSLLDITTRLTIDDLASDVEAVLERLQTIEREVYTQSGRWYVMRLLPYRTGDDRIDGVVLTFIDITERKGAEDRLRRSEAMQAYLLKLSDALRDLGDPVEVQATAGALLGQHLHTDRAYYVEIDHARGEYVVARAWHAPDDESGQARRYPLAHWPMPWLADGNAWVVNDVDTSPALPDDQRDAYRGNGIGATIVIPLLKRGRVVGTFVANQRSPRVWMEDEVVLVRETAERTWVAVQRVRAEAALRESEALLAAELEAAQTLQKISTQLIHEENVHVLYEQILDAAMILMHSDMGSLQMLDPDEKVLRLLAWKGFHPDSAAYWATVTEETQSIGGAALLSADRQIIPDWRTSPIVIGSGSQRHYDLSGIRAIQSTPLLSRDGHVVGMISTHWREPHLPGDRELRLFDVLARQAADVLGARRIEEALRTSEERYRTLFESIDEGFCIVDVLFDESGTPHDYRFVEVNPAFGKQTGLSNAVGRTVRELVPDVEPHWFEAYGRIVQTGMPVRFENIARGLGRIYEVYGFRFGKSANRVAVLFNDITEREKTVEALRQSEQRLQTITSLVPDLLWSSDANGATDWCNQRWLEYTGQTFDDVCGSGWLTAIHPDDRENSERAFREAITTGQPLRLEHRMRNHAGEYRWFLVQAEPLRANSHIVRWFGAATDIHEQRVTRDLLEERVRERTRELTELSAQRQQLLDRLVTVTEEERQRIARELHDEMGQHLTALRVGLETLQRPEGSVDALKSIVQRLDQTVDRLTIELRPPALDHLGLHGAITSLAADFSATSGIRVDLHLPGVDGERFSVAIETAIYRVVQEALTNVLKHSSGKTVSVIVERQQGELRMIIEDDGRGFDSDGAFGGSAVRGRFGLLGMRERLALIGGSLHIESQTGSGAAVYVRVPLRAIAAE